MVTKTIWRSLWSAPDHYDLKSCSATTIASARALQVPPDPLGTIVHVIDMPPGASAPMHRTKTIDYGIVLEGEVYLELDDGSETRLQSGDVVVQRGTAHAWYNRSETVTRMLLVLVDGEFTDELRSMLGEDALSQILR